MTLKNDAKLEKKWLFSKTPDEFGKFSPGHSKVSKLELWGNHLIQNRKCIRLKSTMKNSAKLGQELTFRCKTDMSNLTNFDPSTRKSQTFALNGLLLTKVYNVWSKKVQRSYVLWHWRVMRNLKKKCLVAWKWTGEIWKIFTRALEILIKKWTDIKRCLTDPANQYLINVQPILTDAISYYYIFILNQ